MRRVSPWFLVLAPVVAVSCAYGKAGGPWDDGDGGETPAEGWGDEGDNEPDPGSGDPGEGSTGDLDGDGDPTSGTDDLDGDGDPTTGGTTASGDDGEDFPEDPASCGHDPCSAGPALDPACDPCVAETCDADPYCCSTEWDEQCVGQATSCGCDPGSPEPEPDPGGTCVHDPCIPGGPLDPSCGECAGLVCDVDPFCCETEWDIYCVLTAFGSCFECF